MNVAFGDLRRLYLEEKSRVDEAVTRVLNSGWYILGKELEAFEQKLASYLGIRYVVGCNSGTDAIYLALRCCDIGINDEVITVANTCVPTINGIRLAGATPRFVDIDRDTYVIDTNLVEDHITQRTKAILPVNLYGNSPDYDKVKLICRKHDLRLIEDNAQGIGSKYKNQLLGTIGDIGCFSFYPSKNLGAFGDGGGVVTNNERFFQKAIMIRNHGQSKRYYHELEGINSRLDEIQSAILSVLLDGLDVRNQRRREAANRYLSEIRNPLVTLPKVYDWFQSNYHLFVVRVKERGVFQDYLSSKGIQTLIHYPIPIHLQSSFDNFEFSQCRLPMTEQVSNEVISLPLYPQMSELELQSVINAVNSFKVPC